MSFDDELLGKRDHLLANGIDPYPYSYDRSHSLTEIRAQQEALMDQSVRVVGRVVAYRGKGKMIFADLSDFEGRLQIMFRKNHFDETGWDVVRRQLDLGD